MFEPTPPAAEQTPEQLRQRAKINMDKWRATVRDNPVAARGYLDLAGSLAQLADEAEERAKHSASTELARQGE